MRRALLFLIAAALAAAAHAREEDGALGLLRAPHEAKPAVVSPGQPFAVLAEAPAALRLVGPRRELPLDPEWRQRRDGLHEARVALPAEAPEAPYSIEAAAENVRDTAANAVFVLAPPPEYYVLAHIAAPAVEAGEGDVLRAQLADARAQQAAAVVLTGPLTADGSAAAFREVLAAVRAALIPVYAVGAGADFSQGLYHRYLGAGTFGLQFGRDGLLFYPGGETIGALSGLGAGRLQRLREHLKPLRYTIVFSPALAPQGSFREQLVLFEDDPVDAAVLGAVAGADEPGPAFVWPDTAFFPATAPGAMQLIEVSAGGIRARASGQAAAE